MSVSATIRRDAALMGFTGAATAALQTILVREVFAGVSGNELVIGVMLAVWLGATAAGSVTGRRARGFGGDAALAGLVVSFAAGCTGIRAVRLLFLPGSSVPPQLLVPLLAALVAPGAALGGFVFGMQARRHPGRKVYRWEQAGTLAGCCAVSVAILFCLPNSPIAAAALVPPVLMMRNKAIRAVSLGILILFLAADRRSAAWKYPFRPDRIVYRHEGETASVVLDGQVLTYINGTLHSVSYATPAVEQAVHAPLSMHPSPRRVLLLNDAGHRKEIEKYRGTEVDCIRLDRILVDSCCPFGNLRSAEHAGPYDAVILVCGMPDNAAASRFFTRSFIGKMHELTGDSGVFSFTLPFQAEYTDKNEERIRSILLSTLLSEYRHAVILPGEGFTFIASDPGYGLPDSCPVDNDYFESIVLAGLTSGRIQEANRPPAHAEIHTATHPRLILEGLDRFLRQSGSGRLPFIVFPPVLAMLLALWVRPSVATVSVGTSGLCAGVFSVALIILYQSARGTVYAEMSLILFALSAGFTAGCSIRKFPFSDPVIGAVLGGVLFLLAGLDNPPVPFFLAGNAVAGFLVSAQFVTRGNASADRLYAADCIGGVIGMALASTVLIPLAGMRTVAAGIVAVKTVSGIVAFVRGRR